MPQLFDHCGRPINTGALIGQGGEGAVYEVAGNPRAVAKLYSKPVAAAKQRKLSAMVRSCAPEVLKFAAWPTSTLHSSRGGEVCGITMSRIGAAKDIHQLYSPAQRRACFPTADWHFLLRTARNCAVAFHTLHSHGIVIGDVNHGNVLVSSQAMANFIDCDSFQFRANGELFRCEVGVPFFTPPELQKVRLSTIDRSTNHDCFGLAILVFHLLCVGRHPFSGRFGGSGDLPLERAIAEYRYAYSRNAGRYQMAPPPGALPIRALPPSIAECFERAFGKGSEVPNARPSARQWVEVLDDADKSIVECDDDKGHKFSRVAGECPWCEIEDAGGLNFFISVSVLTFSKSTAYRDPAMLWAAIVSITFPDKPYTSALRFPTIGLQPTPLPPDVADRRLLQKSVGWVALVSGSISPFGIALPSVLAWTPISISVVFAIWWLVLFLLSPRHRERAARYLAYHSAKSELADLEAELKDKWQQYEQDFRHVMDSLSAIKRDIEVVQRDKAVAMQKLQENVCDRQLAAYLDNYFIDSATIKGIGPSRVATLASYGIETAADIQRNAIMSIPGFGPSLTSDLLNWRNIVAAGFRFDPTKGVPQSEIHNLEIQYQHKRHQYERKLLNGPDQLRSIVNKAATDLHDIDKKISIAELNLAQARLDKSVCA